MTCIVGWVHDGDVTIGADTMQTRGDDERTRETVPKLWRWGRRMLVGGGGSNEAIQVARYLFHPPSDRRADAMVYLVRDFCPSLTACLRGSHVLQRKDEVEHNLGLLVAYRGRLFRVSRANDVEETPWGYNGVGWTRGAFGVLFAAREGRIDASDPVALVMLALEAEARHSTYVGPPFVTATLRGQGKAP